MEPIQVQLVNINQPYTEEEIRGRVRQGWHLAGQVLIKHGSGLSTPNNPDGEVGVAPCHMWVANTMAIPAVQVAAAVLQSESKDDLCEALFGITPEQLEEEMS